MKYIILIGDGMADEPLDELGGLTVLQKSNTFYMDFLATHGKTGLAQNVPEGMPAGSDVANMSILGYDPKKYYSGRAPFEAASMGVKLNPHEIAFRCNLITVENSIIADYSAGHITNEEASELITTIDNLLGKNDFKFYSGISYRHLMITQNLGSKTIFTPPHDVIGKKKEEFMPKGEDSMIFSELIDASIPILDNHAINIARKINNKNPANCIWFWGQGEAPAFIQFKDLYGKTGAIISAVDLVKGLGVYAGFDIIDVPGATGYLDTNYDGKAQYALEALKTHDFVIIHVESPDEAGHMGNIKAKIQAIEDFDKKVVGNVLNGIKSMQEDVTILVLPDHPTPIKLKTHTSLPVPFVIYSKNSSSADSVTLFDEISVKKGFYGLVYGADLVSLMIENYK